MQHRRFKKTRIARGKALISCVLIFAITLSTLQLPSIACADELNEAISTLTSLDSEWEGVVSQTESDDSETIYTEDGRPLYEGASDTIYIYNALQTAVSRQDDAANQPVLTGDGDAETFGTGQPIYAPGSDEPLTYSPEHTYVYVDGAAVEEEVSEKQEPSKKDEPAETADKADEGESAEKGDEGDEQDETTAQEDASTIDGAEVLSDGEDGTTGKVLLADADAVSNGIDGRDYVGQTVKNINGTDYILIGNEQQLRAIGTNKHVVDKIWHQDYAGAEWTLEYGGDADLGPGEDLRNEGNFHQHALGVGYTGSSGANGEHDTTVSPNSGLTYSSDANYIIFRDIELTSEWTPLMFSGTMIGAKSTDGSKLWNDKQIIASEKPTISNIVVNQDDPINMEEYYGVGFFATISERIVAEYDISLLDPEYSIEVNPARVENIRLSGVAIETNTSSQVESTSLIEGILGLVGDLLGGVLGLLDTLLGWLLKALGIPDLIGLLRKLVTSLVTNSQKDPTYFATGAFAGRVTGNVTISGCEVVDASVKNCNDYTGGFVGYAAGETEYDGLSDALGAVVVLLSGILDVIPGLGLGDLIDILLGDNGILEIGKLIPTGYANPTFEQNSIALADGITIGSETTAFNGGFFGAQIGTVAKDNAVRTHADASGVTDSGSYSVKGSKYAGGFSGMARNDVLKGTLSADTLGIELIRVSQPQSLTEGCCVNASITVSAGDYAGGFTGAMSNSFGVNDSITGAASVSTSVYTYQDKQGESHTTTGKNAGGYTGIATLGWKSNLGSSETSGDNETLLSIVKDLLISLLKSGDASAGALLSLVGIDESGILGLSLSGTVAVAADGGYAGGIVGSGDGLMLAASDAEHLNKIGFYKSKSSTDIGQSGAGFVHPEARNVTVSDLDSVQAGTDSAKADFAGGIAGKLGTASIAGLLNTTLGVGSYLPFEVADVSVLGVSDGFTVRATGNAAGGAIGEATGGSIGGDAHTNGAANVEVLGIASVKADNRAGGMAGVVGPGDLVGDGGLDLLGLVSISSLLSVAEGVNVSAKNVVVSGVSTGMTIEATGAPQSTDDRSVQYTAGGFIGKANSAEVVDSYVENLLSVKAANYSGYAGGFVGTSATGGLADVSDKTEVESLIKAGNLVTAVSYLIPSYQNVYASYVDAGGVEAEVAGGFAGDFQSGFINTAWNAEKVAYEAVRPTSGDYAVYNIDHVKGRLFAGGFGGRVTSGGLASSGDKGGLSILGDIAGLSINASDLLSLVDAYVPMINYAGVSSTPKVASDDVTDDGFTVTTTSFDEGVSGSGSAGGYIGYASGAQIGYSDVSTLRHTTVEEPKDLEATSAPSYFDGSSSYAVSAPRYAGGFFGLMDIGNAASLGEGLDVLGNSIVLNNVLEALSVVVSTVEHSSVYGAPGGYAVLASGGSANGSATDENGDLGHAGGFAGLVLGGQIQDSNAYNFSHIIGQESAGGYAGTAEPGNVASVLGGSDLLGGLVSTDDALAQLAEDFVPSIRNSETTSVPCAGVVRANAFSDAGNERGMAGGYIGRNEGAQIWGNNTDPWKAATEAYDGPTREAAAWRIRSVYGAEFAGGFTGIMKPAETAETGNLSLLWGLIEVDNVLGALGVAYPTEENTAVYGPLQGLDVDTWNSWVEHVGVNGGYGSDLAASGMVDSPEELEALIANHVYGLDVVAGREEVATVGEANPLKGGSAGGYVGAMIAGTVTNGQAHDVKLVRALRGAGGFAGSAEAGGAATLGKVDLLGINLNLGALLDAAQVFVPVIKSSSVAGYREGMTVTATGAGSRNDDITNATGNAGGYIGYGAGLQIWGDGTVELPAEGEDSAAQASNADARSTASCSVSNLRRVQAPAYAGGYAGRLTSGSTANVNTDGVSDGFLQGVLDTVLDNANIGDLVSVLQATMSTVRGATVSPADDAWGFTVDAYRTGDTVTYPLAAGGFAGSIQATVLGERDASSSSSSALHVEGLRGVDGGLYAGGFVGVAEAGGVAEVAGGTGEGAQTSLLDILKLGNVEVLQAFQPFIYASSVSGSADGITVNAHTWDTGGLLGSKRMSGNAGGFAGTVMSGEVLNSSVEDLNAVSGPNYTGGFLGYTGKSGIADVESVDALDQLGGILGLTAGVANVMGTTVTGCSVEGKLGGYTVSSQGVTGDPEDGGTDASGSTASSEQKAGGFVGYADLAHITDCHATALKLVKSPEVAGGFAGETSFAYLISAEADSALLNAILSVVDQLVKYLYLDDLQHLDAIQLDLLGKALSLDVLSDGNVLSVWLLGINISVSLAQGSDIHDEENDLVKVTIGDSEIELTCNKDGIVWDTGEEAEVTVNLIKGNRSEVTDCSVTGIADGYDVFGGGATQKLDGSAINGYAGGFAGFNNEGKLTGNDMRYADVVRGTAEKTGPFTGATAYDSTYWFNVITDIDQNNTYHVYRDPVLVGQTVTDVSNMTVAAGAYDTGIPDDTTLATEDNAAWARFDVSGHKPVVGSNHGNWDGATVGGADIDVYVSAAKAKLMDDTSVADNTGGLTPEPGDGQDPCAERVNVTIQKVWNDGGDWAGKRPGSIKVRLTATYTDNEGATVKPETIQPTDADGNPVGEPIANPIEVTLTVDDASEWTDTWRKVVENLPVAFVEQVTDADGSQTTVLRYYTYTATEVLFDSQTGATQDPADSDYMVSIETDGTEKVITITNSSLLPSTGGAGTWFIIAAGLMTLVVGGVWLDQQRRRRNPPRAYAGAHFANAAPNTRRASK